MTGTPTLDRDIPATVAARRDVPARVSPVAPDIGAATEPPRRGLLTEPPEHT